MSFICSVIALILIHLKLLCFFLADTTAYNSLCQLANSKYKNLFL